MLIDNDKNNRLVVYFIYDKDGIVDDYIPVMLREVSKYSKEICCVVNGLLTSNSRLKLQPLVDKLIVRENKGFDVGAYKEALNSYGWDTLEQFDEVILMNYTMFGPLRPFDEMFAEMSKKDIDFWGITKHHKVGFDCWGTCKLGWIPEHIQSSFIALRRSIISSYEYRNFLLNLQEIKSYAESVGHYEAIFTKHFEDIGFRSAVYIDTSDLEGYTRYPLLMMADELIINRKCPVLKVKSFSQKYSDIIGDTVGNCTIDVFDYINKNLDYDTDLIWQHILRTANLFDIKNLMHLNYIVDGDGQDLGVEESRLKVALMMHIYYESEVQNCLQYAANMPLNADLIITVVSEEMKEYLESKLSKMWNQKKYKVIVIENRGRDVAALLIGCRKFVQDYDLVCFAHDKKTKQIEPYCVGRSFSYCCFENILYSKKFVLKVIELFNQNKRLGMLVPPPPIHGQYKAIPGWAWTNSFWPTCSLHHGLKLNCPIDVGKDPVAPLGTMFWFRPKALLKLFTKNSQGEWVYNDFPPEPCSYDGTVLHGIERVYPFVVQDAGYYTAWILNKRFARIFITNTYHYIVEFHKQGPAVLSLRQYLWRSVPEGVKTTMRRITPTFVWNYFRKLYWK